MKMTLTLKDLEGRPGLTRAELVHSRTAAMNVARSGKVVTSAGDNGAINIWREKRGGKMHAEFYRACVTVNHVTSLTLADLSAWLKQWWPEMGKIR